MSGTLTRAPAETRPVVDPRGPRPAARAAALAVALVAAAGVGVTWRAFVAGAVGQSIDQAALDGAAYGQTTLWQLAEPVLDVVSISFLLVGTAVAAVVAVLRRRWGLALQAVVLVAGANLTTQVLKATLERPDLDVGGWANTLPSGHTTVAASFAGALVLVAPRRARPWVALLGAVYTAATGVSTLIGQWHRPSDALAAVLVVLAWTAAVCGLGPASSTDPPVPTARGGTAAVVTLLGLVTLGAGLPAAWGLYAAYEAVSAGLAPGAVATYVAGALGVVATSAAAFAALLLVRQSTARRAPG